MWFGEGLIIKFYQHRKLKSEKKEIVFTCNGNIFFCKKNVALVKTAPCTLSCELPRTVGKACMRFAKRSYSAKDSRRRLRMMVDSEVRWWEGAMDSFLGERGVFVRWMMG